MQEKLENAIFKFQKIRKIRVILKIEDWLWDSDLVSFWVRLKAIEIQIKIFFLSLSKNLLQLDYCPQNSTTEVTLHSLFAVVKPLSDDQVQLYLFSHVGYHTSVVKNSNIDK